MSVRRLEKEQPDSFKFTPKNKAWAEELIKKYPQGKEQSAVIPLLWRAQEQNKGWVSEPALRKVAEMLNMAYIRVYEVATFYTMFQLSPVGKKAHIQVCGTTPCMLRGANDLIEVCKKRIAAEPFTLSKDGNFSWEEVECLGACVNAPMIQIFKDTYEDLDIESLNIIIDTFEKGKKPKSGPQIVREKSAPMGGAQSLQDVPPYKPLNLKIGSKRVTESIVDVVEKIKEKPKPKIATGKPAKIEKFEKVLSKSPGRLSEPRGGKKDNLKRIKGIGPKLENKLNDLGFFHFDQIASFTKENIAWIDDKLSFKGRIEREEWLPQAKLLSEGKETEFSTRVDAGKVASSDEEGEA